MKKTITLALAAVLAFALVGPADAKKKKPKKPPAPVPVETQFFLRTDADCEALSLSLTDGTDESDCFYVDTDMFNEYPQIASQFGDPVKHYTASEGVPLKLDPSRKVTGSITIRGGGATLGGQAIQLGLGEPVVDITLKATIAGEEKVLGTVSHAYTVTTPGHMEQVDFEIALDSALAGVTVDGLTLDVFSHGMIIGGRGVEHDSEVPPSIKIPAFQ